MLTIIGEVVLSVIFIILLLMKVDPFDLLMPNHLQMFILGLLVAAFGLYAGALFRQRIRDEREGLHLHRASRFAYIGGVTLLVAGITVQSFEGSLDPWLVYILAGMVIIKLAILVWSRIRN